MEILKSLGTQSPIIIASLILAVACLLKAGKERGAILILLGAIGLCVSAVLTPLFYSGIMPKLMENNAPEDMQSIFLLVAFVVNFFWAGAIGLIAVGTWMRKTEYG